MTITPKTPITRDERLFLSIAVDEALEGHLGECLPYSHKCQPITSIEELERRFRVLDWAASLISAAARADVHESHFGVPYSQTMTDATNFVRAAEGMSDWLRPKRVNDRIEDKPE